MRRLTIAIAFAAAAVMAGCQVDFMTGNEFQCPGHNIQSTCLAGYLCCYGTCQAPPCKEPDTIEDAGGAIDIVETVDSGPEIDVPVDTFSCEDYPAGGTCTDDEESTSIRTHCGVVCSAEGVWCDEECEGECSSCTDPETLGVCTPKADGTNCSDAPLCNACNGQGDCVPRGELEEIQCGNCQQCGMPGGGAGLAECLAVPAGADPFLDCGDDTTDICGRACDGEGACDMNAASQQNGVRCDVCHTCLSGSCVPMVAGSEDEECGDPICGGMCAEGGECSTDFVDAETACATCHICDGNGRCRNVVEGTPDIGCQDENPCGRTGLCDEEGGCAIRAVGFPDCADESCEGIEHTTWSCNDSQECVATVDSCAPYSCEQNQPVCRTGCHGAAPCAEGFFCNASNDCEAKKLAGVSCGAAAECADGYCVDGVCCNSLCNGLCEVCDGSPDGVEAGTCAIAVGLNPRTSLTGVGNDCDGQLDACDGVCADVDGEGQCDFSDTAGVQGCGTCKYCSPAGDGRCINRPATPRFYDDCEGDEECGGWCEDGSCVAAKPSGTSCGDGPCDVCTDDAVCGLAETGTNPKGLCTGEEACGGGCQADGSCGEVVVDGTRCGSDDDTQPCYWCRSGRCQLIAPEDTPTDMCGGGDDACRARCTATGHCGPPMPSGADCDLVCHRCDGAGICAFISGDDEPDGECPGDDACGARCMQDACGGLGCCGQPQPEGLVCGEGDGCSTCQPSPTGDMFCLPRTDTPPGACEGVDDLCDGRCGSFGVCEWPGQEEYCAECSRCDGAGACVALSTPEVAAQDCGGDDEACVGICVAAACNYQNTDGAACGGDGGVCQTCNMGICELVEQGNDPLGQCNPFDDPVCGEKCDGAGGCEAAPGPDSGTAVPCGDSCKVCDGLGQCVPVEEYGDDPRGVCQADEVCVAGSCTTCGNGVREEGEICDPNDPLNPCEGVCSSPDPCVVSQAINCQCVESPVLEADDGTDGCCPPIENRELDPDCRRWSSPLFLNPDPFQPFTYGQLPAVDATTGTLYIGGRDLSDPTPQPRIFAVSPAGEILWDVSTASDPAFASAATSSPVLVGDKLYFGRATRLVEVDITTRAVREVVNLGAVIREPPVATSTGILVVGTGDGVVRGINPAPQNPGEEIEWTYATGGSTLIGPGVQAGRFIYWGSDAIVHYMELAAPPTTTGSSACYTAPVSLGAGGVSPGQNNSLYVADQSGAVYLLNPPMGAACGLFNSDPTTVGGQIDASPLTLADGTVLIGGHDPNLNPNPTAGLYNFSRDLTDVVWTEVLGEHVRFTPVIGAGPDGDRVYVGLRKSQGVRIVAINPGFGADEQGIDWTFEYTVPDTPSANLISDLAIGTDGTLYFRTSDGSLNAVVTSSTNGLSTTGWPKRYGDYGNTGTPPE